MKKKILALALCVLMISGCGSKIPKLSNGDEAVVTFNNGTMISANELYEELKSTYAQEKLVNMIDKKILEDKYKDKVEEAKANLETHIQTLEQTYGDNLESTIQQYTGSTLQAYKDSYYIYLLQTYAIKDYCKDQITEKQIKKYYDTEIESDIKVSHILITPKATSDMTDDEKEAAEKEAKEKINTIVAELKKTNKADIIDKFAELAKEYSDDTTTSSNGGSLGFINKDTLTSSYDELVKAAYKLKDGEYSTTMITTELGYHIILRTETKEKASLEDVKDNILTELSDQYLSENPVAQIKALQELRKDYGMEIIDTDIQAEYAKNIQNALQYYEKEATNK